MRHKDATPSDLYRLAMWLTVEELQLRAVLDEAVSTVLEASKAGLWEHAVQCEHSEESPFTYDLGNGRIVSGVVDLMYKDRAAWHIIDCKTDLDMTEAGGSYAASPRSHAFCRAAGILLLHYRESAPQGTSNTSNIRLQSRHKHDAAAKASQASGLWQIVDPEAYASEYSVQPHRSTGSLAMYGCLAGYAHLDPCRGGDRYAVPLAGGSRPVARGYLAVCPAPP